MVATTLPFWEWFPGRRKKLGKIRSGIGIHTQGIPVHEKSGSTDGLSPKSKETAFAPLNGRQASDESAEQLDYW
ncbi:hypothetical protein [Pandoraea anhela]|uniref:hypothetical protein n=1 Tax=Pandoraea anhela TaxID=2508295 RepID=UPI001581541A|nr:hypothetical protein [Pandoraea anhela]